MSDAGDEAEEERVAPPKEILKAEINTQYNLPVRAEKFRYAGQPPACTNPWHTPKSQ